MTTKPNNNTPSSPATEKPKAGRGASLEIDEAPVIVKTPKPKAVDVAAMGDMFSATAPEPPATAPELVHAASETPNPEPQESAPLVQAESTVEPPQGQEIVLGIQADGSVRLIGFDTPKVDGSIAPSPVTGLSAPAVAQVVVASPIPQITKESLVAYEGDANNGSDIAVFGERPEGYDGNSWRASSHRIQTLFDSVQTVKSFCKDNMTTIKVLEVVPTSTGEPMLTSGYKFTMAGLESLWSIVGLNVGTLADLRQTKHAGEYNDFVIRMLNDALRKQNQSREVNIRLRQVKLKGVEEREWRVRAVKPAHYLVFDNDTFINIILAASPESWGDPMKAFTPHVHYTGDELTGTMIPEAFISTKTDGEWGFGINFANSEIGGRNATTDPYAFRGMCFNGCIFRQTDLSVGRFVQRHTGLMNYDQAVLNMKVAMEQGIGHAEALYGRFEVSREIKVTDPKLMIVELAISSGLTTTQGRAWYQGLTDTLSEFGTAEDQTSVADIANGLTRAAQMFKGSDATRLQELAGGLLFADSAESEGSLRERFDSYSRRSVLNRTVPQVDQYLTNSVVVPNAALLAA